MWIGGDGTSAEGGRRRCPCRMVGRRPIRGRNLGILSLDLLCVTGTSGECPSGHRLDGRRARRSVLREMPVRSDQGGQHRAEVRGIECRGDFLVGTGCQREQRRADGGVLEDAAVHEAFLECDGAFHV